MKTQISLSSLVVAALLSATAARAQWTTVGSAGFSTAGQSTWQHLVFDANNTAYVSFNDAGLSAGQGTVMKFDGAAWTTLGNAGFTSGSATNSFLAVDAAGHAYFSYADGADSSQVAVMEYDGTSWNSIGDNLTSGAGSRTNIVRSSGGTLYLSYLDADAGNGVFVRRYNGTTWDTLGGGMVSGGNANYPSLAISHSDTLYIAYQDFTDNGRARVKKFDGTNWVNVGSSFLSEVYGGANDISLTFDTNDTLYVGYWNPYAGGPKVAVHKFDGANWNIVGTPSFTTGVSLYTSLVVDHNNVPYIAYQDATASQQANVMKFDGSGWVNLGTAGFSAGSSEYTSIALDANDNPFVAYSDGANSQKTTVSKYILCNAPSLAAPTASDSVICHGDTVQISVAGNLNDATNWYWYTGSCGGTLVDSGASVQFVPVDTTTYYVRAFGGCVLSSACVPVTIDVNTVPQPVISANGAVLTSSAATGNQWYLNGTLIPGATGQTYTATVNGAYTVTVTSNNCSSTSAAEQVSGLGISGIIPEGGIELYPVPFDRYLQVNCTAIMGDPAQYSLQMTDYTGRVVYSRSSLQQRNTLQTAQLSPGIYFIRVSGMGGSKSYKIVKQ